MVVIDRGEETLEWPFTEPHPEREGIYQQSSGILWLGRDRYLEDVVRLFDEDEAGILERTITYYDVSIRGTSDAPTIRYTSQDDGERFEATCESSLHEDTFIAYDCEGLLYERTIWTVGYFEE